MEIGPDQRRITLQVEKDTGMVVGIDEVVDVSFSNSVWEFRSKECSKWVAYGNTLVETLANWIKVRLGQL